MEENKDIQIQVKKIPAFTVLKNGSILKNIFLLRKQSAVDISSQNQESDEEILLVGRHPHCHITLEHPSISRYHIRIYSNPSSHTLSVVDLSSVHGTWVSGQRIEPGVHVKLKEGDTVTMGGSSRVYELHWVPLSQAYDEDQQFVPAIYTIKEGEEEPNQDEKLDTQSSDDDSECSDLSLSNKIHDSPLKTLNPLTSSVPNYFNSSCDDTKVEHSSSWRTDNRNGEVFDAVSVQDPLVVSETSSATEISDSLNNYEDHLDWLRDNLSNKSSPWKTDNKNGEIFGTVSVQTTVVVSETRSETDIADSLNNSEDQLNWLRDNLSNEFEQLSHKSMKNDPVSVDLFDAIKTQEKYAIDQDISDSLNKSEDWSNRLRDNLTNAFEQISHQTMNNDLVSVNLFDTIKTQEKDALNQEITRSNEIDIGKENESEKQQKIDNVSVPDGTGMDQEQIITPEISKTKEVDMNLESMKNFSIDLFDSLDGNELEFYTPDKENKNPNACSGNSLLKKAVSPAVYGEKDIFGFPKKLFAGEDESNNVFTTDEGIIIEHKVDPIVYCEEVLFNASEKETKSREIKIESSCKSINYPGTVQKVIYSSQNLAKKRWIMVVDTNSLLHNESLKHLKLLEGLKGTQLFVPKIVIRELKSQDNFLKRSIKKVSLAFEWIDECMVNTKWWIHVDDDDLLNSSTAVPDVLEIALNLRKEITDQNIIILSNDLTLKIKAMAEGIMCEEAEEFGRSLVNPFSERFMWVGSSARGLTWSYVDDDIMRQKYYSCGLNGSRGLKGLKLLARV